ncbi:hypothetical protein AAMO2058_001383500 [Amorphochlora amoebiformis]
MARIRSFRRFAITSKRGNKNFYKGRGAPARKMGFWISGGKFVIDPKKAEIYTFKAPDLSDFKLKPYVEVKK